MVPDLALGYWDIIAIAALVLGPAPTMTIVAGGVTGLMVRGASVARSLFIGLGLGIVGAAASVGSLILYRALGGSLAELFPGILPVMATSMLFAAATIFLTRR